MILPSYLSAYAGKRVLVTGDTGFKGAWLSFWLHELGAEVFGLALPPVDGGVLFSRLGLDSMIRHTDGDIRDLDTVQSVFAKARPEIVFHLAAQALVRHSYAHPHETFATNVLGSVNVMEAVRSTDCARALVYITSDKCYLNKEWPWGYRENDELGGRDPYSASKACAELAFFSYARSFFDNREGFGAASTRAGNVIGGGDRAADRLVPDAVRALEKGQPLVLRNPRATRPWQHVLEPLHGYLKLGQALLADPQAFSGSWNFGPDDPAIRCVEDLARTFLDIWGEGEIRLCPDTTGPHEANLLHLASDKAHRQLGWRPLLDFEATVGDTARWYRAVHDQGDPLAVTRGQIAAFTRRISP